MKIYLSEEQYKQLLKDGSITVGETTVIYNEDDEYITPFGEYVDLTSNQEIGGNKYFTGYVNLPKYTNFSGEFYIENAEPLIIMSDDGSPYQCRYGFGYIDNDMAGNYRLTLPTKTGMLATTDDIPKYYKHDITLNSGLYKDVQFTVYSQSSVGVNDISTLYNIINTRRQPMTCVGSSGFIYVGYFSIDTNTTYIEATGIGTNNDIMDNPTYDYWTITDTVTEI